MSVAICLSDHDNVRRRSGAGRAQAFRLVLGLLIAVCSPGLAFGKDEEEEEGATEKVPNLYLDLNTVYTALPAGALGIGFKNFTSLPTLNSPASQSVTQNVPLTLDLNDRITVYGGFSGSTSRTDDTSWSSVAIDSWNAGFQADVIAQNGGLFPTVTLQSTLTRTIGSSAPATTFTNILEFDYALDADETKGLLAGIRYVKVALDTEFAKIEPSIIGYVGGYYQWPGNWKLSGRFGV